ACRPAELLPGARSIVALAASYWNPSPPEEKSSSEPPAEARLISGQSPPPLTQTNRGRIARYAWGEDYHFVLRERMRTLVEDIGREIGYPPGARLFVDSSPLADRAVAQRAGVGWVGKNTNVLV